MSDSNNSALDQALAFCDAFLMASQRHTEDDLRQAVERVLGFPDGVIKGTPPEPELLMTHLQARYSVHSEDYGVLFDPDTYQPWWRDRKGVLNTRFWNRYKIYLEKHVGLPPDTVNRLDTLTDDILDRLKDPDTGGVWDRRGMVVGQVQSGKTGNYIGLINKAADAGYRVIVVLAGIHEGLRAQTQIRLDKGFLGYDTQTYQQGGGGTIHPNQRVGVGRIKEDPTGIPLTSGALKGDFRRGQPNMPLGGEQPVVLVVKKNASVLRNLVCWLMAQGDVVDGDRRVVRNAPLLVIDDEADNASINVSRNHVSRINSLIRSLLGTFERSAYVGYTATPFANIFIPMLGEDEDPVQVDLCGRMVQVGQDLFPKDFIINIPPPSNYIGPAQVFGLPALEDSDKDIPALGIVRMVSDYQDLIPNRHKKDGDLPDELPGSMERAVKCFLLVCAARAARGQKPVHNSMLVHVTRFIRWQDQIATLLDRTLKTYQAQIAMSDPQFLKELETLWKSEFVPVTASMVEEEGDGYKDPEITRVSWEKVLAELRPAAAKISVRAVHGTGNRTDTFYRDVTPLDYNAEEARGGRLSVIAVGGDKLSRGLTLEGLSVSYYLRASRMYDTLMQMGRWFGYRPGYADLCRLFTSPELRDWYEHIAVASEELRREFDFMVALHRTPRDYGLKVRAHPGVLRVTAASKFRDAIRMELSYSNTLVESYRLSLEPSVLEENRRAVADLLGALTPSDAPDRLKESGHFYFSGQDSATAVAEFVRRFRVLDRVVIDGDKVAEYIAAQNERQELTDWTVVLVNRVGGAPTTRVRVTGGDDIPLNAILRTNALEDEGEPLKEYHIRKNHIISPSHEGLDLDSYQYQEAKMRTWEARRERHNGPPGEVTEPRVPTGEMMRYKRGAKNGLLLLYALNLDPDATGEVEPVMGYAVSFPWIARDKKISYFVNQQFFPDLDYDDEPEDEFEDD